MRFQFAVLILLISAEAAAQQPTVSPDLERLLTTNAREVHQGTNDPERLFAGLRRLADKGDSVAQFLSGLFSIQTAPEAAVAYLDESADAGCVGSAALHAALTMEGPGADEAAKRMFGAAQNGDATAQTAVSGFYERGDFGFEQSPAKSYAWMKLAERQSFSLGALQAIREQMKALDGRLSERDREDSEREYASLSKEVPKVDYYLCGQMNVDTSREPAVFNILQPRG